jgi:opacity protein-like surface antigen
MRRFGLLALLLILLPGTASALERYQTVHRFGVSLGFGFGSAALSSFHDGADRVAAGFKSVNPSATFETPKSGFQINAEVGFRYYFPYYILGHVGVDAVYNRAAASFGGSYSFNTDQLALEVPILVGGYYPFFGRLYVFGAIGPSPNFYQRSWISYDPGGHTIYNTKSDPNCGFHFLTGAEFLVTRSIGVGLELRYRYLKSGDLKNTDTGTSQFGSYILDLSGISLGIVFRVFAM